MVRMGPNSLLLHRVPAALLRARRDDQEKVGGYRRAAAGHRAAW